MFGKHFVPKPHAISTIERNSKDLDEISTCNDFDKRVYSFNRALTPDETQFVYNERALCASSYPYWSSRFAWLKDWTGKTTRYKPNLAQRIFDDILADMENDEVELILQFLKARRLGVSTEVQLRLCHRLLFIPDTQIIMASDNPEDSDKLSKMLFLAWERQPHWLRSPLVRYKRGLYYEFANGNRIDLEHGSQESDYGRGENPTAFHLTEMAKVQNPESLVDSGLMRAVIPSPYVFGVLEGTAQGDDGWWHDKYWWNKHNYGKPGTGARMRPTFLPWVVGMDIYPSETTLKTLGWDSIKDKWEPQPETASYSKSIQNYVRSSYYISKHMGKYWKMPREQMFYYEASIKEYEATNTLHVWSQEMAADDVSAFASREHSVFDPHLRLKYHRACAEPVAVYGIRKGGIPEKFWPQRRDFKLGEDGQPIIKRVVADWNPHLPPLEFEFVELKFHGYSETDPFGKLFVWEQPEDGNTYAFGADVSDGFGVKRSDNSTLEMFRKGSRWKLDSQVSEFACLGPGSMVVTPSGVKRIENVQKGDEVITRLGQTAKVAGAVKSRHSNGVAITTALGAHIPLHLTDDHLVATQSGWMEAGKLKKGDMLRYPVRPLTYDCLNPVPIRYKRQWYDLQLSWEFGFMCGLYVTEGNANKRKNGRWNSLRFTLHKREAEPWREIMQRVCPDWHIDQKRTHNSDNADILCISCESLSEWFEVNFGRTTGKHIPSWVWGAPRAFVEGLVLAMVAGDGSVSQKCREASYVSTAPALVTGLRDLVLSLGWGMGVIGFNCRDRFALGKRKKKFLDIWKLNFYAEVSEYFMRPELMKMMPKRRGTSRRCSLFRWGWNKQWIYVPVRKVVRSDETTFYDIGVEGPEPSFCVIQAAVHNSPDMSGADLWLIGLALGTYFTVYVNGRLKQPRCVPEINREGGQTFLREMDRRGWKQFHEDIKASSTRRGTPTITRGWRMNPVNREDLVQKGVQAIRDEYIEINSPWLVSEMDALIKHPDGKIGAAKGRHDDRLICLWLAFVSSYYDDVRSTGKSPFMERMPRELEAADKYLVYRHPQASEDAPKSIPLG